MASYEWSGPDGFSSSLQDPTIADATLAMAGPCEDAFRYALEAVIVWLEEDYGLSRIDAYLLLGQILEARCTQFVNPTFTYITKVNKNYLISA